MIVSGAAIGTAIALLSLPVGSYIQSRLCEIRSRAYDVSKFQDAEFRAGPFNYWVCAVVACLGVIFIKWAVEAQHTVWLGYCVGSASIAGSLFVAMCLRKAWVRITRQSVTYSVLGHAEEVPMNEIRTVSTDIGLIIIDAGKVPKLGIPLYFRDSARMLAMLRYYR